MYGLRVLAILLVPLVAGVGFSLSGNDENESPESIEMISTVCGSMVLKKVEKQIIENGGFEIIRNKNNDDRVKEIGDGIDEFTLWTFDFSEHQHIETALECVDLKPEYVIKQARLHLVVKPMAESGWTDAVYIQGSACNHVTLKHFNPPGLYGADTGVGTVLEYDLIKAGHYWPEELHYYLRLNHSDENTDQKSKGFAFCVFDKTKRGQLPMILRDDTIVSQATLALRFEKTDRSNYPDDSPYQVGEHKEDSCVPTPAPTPTPRQR